MLGSTRSASRGSAVSALPLPLLLTLLLMTSPCGGCREKIDLLLVIDSSGSIRDNNPADGSFDNWQLVKDFLRDLIATFDIGPVSIDDENVWPGPTLLINIRVNVCSRVLYGHSFIVLDYMEPTVV